MLAATTPLSLACGAAAVAAAAAFAGTMRRHRADPTARPLVWLATALLGGAVLHLAVVEVAPVRAALGIPWSPTEARGGFWLLLAFDVPAVVAGCWFLFALQYTGRDRRTAPVAWGAVGVLLALLVGATGTLALVGPGAPVPASTLNALLGFTVVLSTSLALLGLLLVADATAGTPAVPAGQSALLGAGVGVALALPFAATAARRPVVTPLALGTAALLLTGAVRRYRVFETLPVASTAGRDQVFADLSAGVVVVGPGGVRDLNDAASSLLDVDRDAALGAPLSTVAPSIPAPETAAASGPLDARTPTGRVVAVTADPVTDRRDRVLGHVLVCRDVTERRRRERRLGVLTQVIAGATGEAMADVAAEADRAVQGERPPSAAGEAVYDRATALADLVARVREVERALADRSLEPGPHDLGALVDEAAAATGATTAGSATPTVRADPSLLAATLEVLGTVAGDGASLAVAVDGHEATVTVAPIPVEDADIAREAVRVARAAAADGPWTVSTPSGEQAAVVSVPLAAARPGVTEP